MEPGEAVLKETEAAAVAPNAKGFGLIPKSKPLQKPPPELAVMSAVPDPASVKPTPVLPRRVEPQPAAAAPRGSMFGPKAVVAKPVKPVAKPKVPKPSVEEPATLGAPVEEALAKEEAAAEAPAAPVAAKKKFAFKRPDQRFADAEEEELFTDVTAAVTEEQEANPYLAPAGPPAFVPQTRRAFRGFIRTAYNKFILGPKAMPTPAGDKYPYQKFIREYMRQESPYRGVLVYHGLGSGKTCTSIAAAEALFSTAHKKIIVMSPKSLQKNFLNEISACGFRHFRLQNFWVPFSKKIPEVALFAREVLNLSETYLGRNENVWIPDFSKTPEEANYRTLGPDAQKQIREQIIATLFWDPKRNPTGRIRFIAYNGITSKRLQEFACTEKDFFDDAVIVVDEIHNVVRLMQGTIDPYLIDLKGVKRLLPPEPIQMAKWNPAQCDPAKATKYARGYYFYRLLVQAQNSKIIGLSGTPLINFPEELGILMNVLHGYIPMIRGSVTNADGSVPEVDGLRTLLESIPYLDFVEVTSDAAKRKAGEAVGGVTVTVTFLEEGVRRLEAPKEGVERIPEDEERPTYAEIADLVFKTLEENKYTFGRVAPKLQTVPLLPPFGDTFREKFINMAGVVAADGAAAAPDAANPFNDPLIKNKLVLVKRLSGMISYYRGSRADLMPRVAEDTVIRVPMSPHQQQVYSVVRAEEISSEKKPKAGEAGALGGVWAEVYDVGKSKQSSNYKMASRQACNFAFPPEVRRPKANSREEELAEAQAGNPATEDLVDTAPDGTEPRDAEDFPELEAFEDATENDVMAAAAEDAAIEDALAGAPEADEAGAEAAAEPAAAPLEEEYRPGGAGAALAARQDQEGGGKEDEDAAPPAPVAVPAAPPKKFAFAKPPAFIRQPEEVANTALTKDATLRALSIPNEPGPSIHAPAKKFASAMKQKATTLAAATAAQCKAGQQKGQTYKDACLKAKECLATTSKAAVSLEGDKGLASTSPKFAAMLERIVAAPGSSLVYSQFLDMEGIGIFRVAMEANGYVPIEVLSGGAAGLQFSPRTAQSFESGEPVPRFITFSGGEEEDVRRTALDIFNANFDVLPAAIKKVLDASGLKNNHKGEICRVFCITKAGAEGLSLKCVRAVHIMEPYWNEALLTQVKGRAIRIGSHLELPEAERDVSIYTYLSAFSEEAQLQRGGEGRIDETIRNSDAVERKDAEALGLPIPAGAATYVLTTDERLYSIATRKRLITTALERVMKSAAVDCQLNLPENNVEGDPVMCLGLDGAVGDFLYHPDLDLDIAETESTFQGTKAKGAEAGEAPSEAVAAAEAAPSEAPKRMIALPKPAAAAVAKPVAKATAPAAPAKPGTKPVPPGLPPGTLLKAFKGTPYLMVPKPSADGTISGFTLYAEADVGLKKPLGIAGAKADQPAPPVEFFA